MKISNSNKLVSREIDKIFLKLVKTLNLKQTKILKEYFDLRGGESLGRIEYLNKQIRGN